jgi:hypothetical protein
VITPSLIAAAVSTADHCQIGVCIAQFLLDWMKTYAQHRSVNSGSAARNQGSSAFALSACPAHGRSILAWRPAAVIGAVGQAEETNAGAAMQGDRQGEARGAL